MRKLAIGFAIGAVCVGCGDSAPPRAAAPPSQDFAAAAANRAPVVESVRLDPAEPAQDAVVHSVVTARDPDGQPVTLARRWFVDGAEQQASGDSFSLQGVAKGAQIRVSVTASDGTLVSDAVDATARVIDRPPQIGSIELVPAGSVSPGQPITARVGASDPDGDAVEYDYAWYVNGERRSETGSMFKTDGLKSGDSIYAEVRASDGSNTTDPLRSPEVKVGSAHPEITSKPPGFREDGTFRYQVVAVDPDGDKRLRYSLEKGPDGMTIDNVLGEVVWRPHDPKPGEYPVVVGVRDSAGLETKQSFSVTVQHQERAVVSTPAAPAPDSDATGPHRRHTRPATTGERPSIEDRTH